MNWLRHRTSVTVALLMVGATLLLFGWYEKRGYVDRVASGARATAEARFDNRDFERAARNLFAAPDLLAYDQGVRAYAAAQPAVAARHFQDVLALSDSPTLRARAYYNLGNLFVLRGKLREAAEMYRQALRLDPMDWDAKSNLEMLYARLGAPDDERSDAALRQAGEPGVTGDGRGRGSGGSRTPGI